MQLILFFKKIKSRGVIGTLERFKQFLLESKLSPLRLTSFIHRVRIIKRHNSLNHDQSLWIVWDLRNQVVNFNVCEYLCLLEFVLREHNRTSFTILVVSDADRQEYSHAIGYQAIVSATKRRWQQNNIMIPLMRMHPLVQNLIFVNSAYEAERHLSGRDYFPPSWSPSYSPKFNLVKYYLVANNRNSFRGLEPNPQAVNYVRELLDHIGTGFKVVTITIRDYAYDIPRNSDKSAWSQFFVWLIGEGFWPIVIPDTERPNGCDSFFPNHHILKEFCWNLYLRFALYNLAYFNFSSPNGPPSMMLFSKECRFLMMGFCPPGSEVHRPEAFSKMGMSLGDQYKFCTKQQVISYLPETYENIKNEFSRIRVTL